MATLMNMEGQHRIVLRNIGKINPLDIEECIANDGYQGLAKAVTSMTQDQVIQEVKDSGLRGRGGAGFPAGLKWSFTKPIEADQKYIICNADEGEPGTFKDRMIMEGDPHLLIEGITIAGYAVGATKGFIYVRGEYPLSLKRLAVAIQQAREYGLLGSNIFGSGFDFDIEIREGAGAYMVGEETALMESIEGNRGMSRFKPPYPGVSGLWCKPTIINNVETLSNVPQILVNGGEWYSKIGTAKCTGTKIYLLMGIVQTPGAIEVPFGITLRRVIDDFGGGLKPGSKFKFAQVGGTAGAILTEEHMDVAMDYDSLAAVGASLGSGAVLVVDDSVSAVDFARVCMRFFKHESCGGCTPCREGTYRLHQLVSKIQRGEGVTADLDLIEELCYILKDASLCGLGQAAPVPMLDLLKYFRNEFEEKLKGGKKSLAA